MLAVSKAAGRHDRGTEDGATSRSEEAEDLGATIGALIGLGLDGDAGLDAGAAAGWQAGSDGHLIGDEELWSVADTINPGSVAVIALLEHIWAAPLRDAHRHAPAATR